MITYLLNLKVQYNLIKLDGIWLRLLDVELHLSAVLEYWLSGPKMAGGPLLNTICSTIILDYILAIYTFYIRLQA